MSYKGKAIYNPVGAAGEYAPWACNFYNGCSNDCDYCYCKRGVMSHVWTPAPTLKKCFKNQEHAKDIFLAEMEKNIDQLKEYGLFFSFTTDPMLPETLDFHIDVICMANAHNVPVQILTKRADFLHHWLFDESESIHPHRKNLIAVGFTLTGCDEREPNASLNVDRVKAMLELHKRGFKTFASIEPVISVPASYSMINAVSGWCDLIKVGLLSGGKRSYKPGEIQFLYEMIKGDTRGSKFYLKDSIIKYLGIDRDTLPSHFVSQNHNIFKQ